MTASVLPRLAISKPCPHVDFLPQCQTFAADLSPPPNPPPRLIPMPPRPITPAPPLAPTRVPLSSAPISLRFIEMMLSRPMRAVPLAHRAIPQIHAAHNRVVARHERERLGLAEFLWAPRVRGVQRGVEEIAHGLDDGAGGEEVGHGAGAVAAEGGGEGAGFDELGSDTFRDEWRIRQGF
jgi:hypothetical protein